MRLGESLAAEVAPDGLVLLVGDLGSGKTVLTQGIAAGLGVDPDEVQSPTFILMREHEGTRTSLVHVDLYRLDPGEVEGLGLEEVFAGPGVKVVEWADRLSPTPPADLALELVRGEEAGLRTIREGGGEAGEER